MPASVVIGQPDFTSNGGNQGTAGTENEQVTGNSLDHPAQTMVIDGKLFITDGENERVLIYNSIPTTNNAVADLVIGQIDLNSDFYNGDFPTAHTLMRPEGIATNGEKLIILDRDNYRILVYNEIPTENYPAADIVIGQPDMTTHEWHGDANIGNSEGVSDTTLSSGATGLCFDEPSGKLIVSDTDNNRVLIYGSLPTTNGVAADVVIGQPDFYSNLENQGGDPSANTLSLGTSSNISTYNDKLFVADRHNNRVLIFNQIPTTNNASADVVIGQPDFNSNQANQGGEPGPNTLNGPRSAVVDSEGKLLITDLNHRILVFNSIPVENNASADLVIGQPDFESNTGSATDSTFFWPRHVSFYGNKFIVSDNGNSRVLIFENDDDNMANDDDNTAPLGFLLNQNYPNPFNSSTIIKYSLSASSHLELRIFDLQGLEVVTLFRGQHQYGNHQIIWDGKNSDSRLVASGIYFIRMESSEIVRSRKMIFVQ
ncbi:MAG: T9SS type A sorting domain-containing protein [Bacteroidetes bacterium]|nr:T9SS type A sorting domain-containing protein [Bacteroidota bacterium]